MRLAGRVAVVAVAVWLGASCRLGTPCSCPPAQPVEGGLLTITRSTLPGLVGGEVDARPDKVVIRYMVDNTPHEVVFSAAPM